MHKQYVVKQEANVDPQREKLKATLALHKFQFAAKEFNEKIDFQKAINAWENYPHCMSKYPTRLNKRP